MTWFAIHDNANGELLSISTVVDDAALPSTVSKAVLTGQPNFATHRWDTSTRSFVAIPPPTDDDLVLAMPRKPRLTPTVAVGKVALKELLDEQVQLASAWEWFTRKVSADAVPQAVKDAVTALASDEYAEAKRLGAAWRQAP